MQTDWEARQADINLDLELRSLRSNITGLRQALEHIQKEAADTSRDGDARRLETQMSYIAGTAEDALRIFALK